MTRPLFSAAMVAVVSVVTLGLFPVACQSGGIGDPCIPEDEYDPEFPGFKVTQEFIESRSFQCQSRICLVNHFQGRVSCPLGQDAPESCANPGEACGSGGTCVEAAVDSPSCTKKNEATDCAAYGGVCNARGGFCECVDACPKEGYTCAANDGPKQCRKFVCHEKNNCQQPGDEASKNKDKDCCIPGTDTPVAQPVCGQCGDQNRNAAGSVYCSCRCAPPPESANDPENQNANYCTCPDGFECKQIRQDIGLGDKLLAGGYCIRAGSEYKSEAQCGQVKGSFEVGACAGTQSAVE